MPIAIGDKIEVQDPDSSEGWLQVRVVRRGSDEEMIERPSKVPKRPPLKIPVWIVEITGGPRKGEQLAVPNGTIARLLI
jgi:hypothetical protein